MAAGTPPAQENNTTVSTGLVLALSAAFLFSTKPILIKWLYGLGMTALPLMGLRLVIALPLYVIVGVVMWGRLANKPSLRDVCNAAAIGLLGYYLASYLDLSGLEYVSAQLERLMLYAYPSMVVIMGALFFGAKVNRSIIPALILTYAGLAVMYGHDLNIAPVGTDPADITKGTLLILASALSFSLYVLFSKKSIARLGSLLFTSIAMGSATIATIVHYAIVEGAVMPDMTAQIWGGVLILAIMATVVPSFMVSEAIKRIGPAKTSVSGTIGPVMTTIMAIMFLGEPFGWLTALGMALVMLGVTRLQK
ncbi:MAG: DMT family transporter [Alcanivorax sp.]|jgi:drug/metabolite transporter (DMT)-like permease|nr:MAG: EamA family transporter [Oceanobacter sp.]|tara:strand:- start:1119 stop:2042 length:924 start_codon:yes stop_codon:yes gene_type:complete